MSLLRNNDVSLEKLHTDVLVRDPPEKLFVLKLAKPICSYISEVAPKTNDGFMLPPLTEYVNNPVSG